ncbi:MAG: CHASE2 domain-containing protein [Methylococcus sp.]|nr:CHASE2 domain-containing protein [Methylococcus sp.]
MAAASAAAPRPAGSASSRKVLAAGCLLTGLMALLQLAGWAPGAQLDAFVFDRLVRLYADAKAPDHAAVVDIDDNALSAVGQWPWPRYRIAALVKAIDTARPRAIGIDILFPEPDRTSLSTLRESFRREFGLELAFSGVPPGLEDNDGYLGSVLAATGALGSIFFYSDLRNAAGPPCPLVPLRMRGVPDALSPYEGKGVLCNTPEVQRGLTAQGFVNTHTDADGRLRRLAMLYGYEGQIYPSLSLALLMRVAGTDTVEVGSDVFGPVLKVGEFAVPVDERGAALLRFRAPARRISALDMLRDDYESQALAGRIVLVGSTAVGLADRHRTAIAPDLSGAEAHAALLDGILDGLSYREPIWQPAFSLGAILAAGFAAALLFARLPALQATLGALLIGAALAALSLGLFASAGVVLSLGAPVLTLAVESGVLSFLLYRRHERMAAASRRAREAAEAASRAKSEFLARMSHEIRTPLHGMLSAADLLFLRADDARQKEYADIVRGSGRTLLAMLNDILDLSKIEAGRLELEILDFDLREVVDALALLFGVQAQAKDLDLICHLEPEVPSCLRGDPGCLRQVLSNLIGNAIKFTPQGRIVVRVSVAQADEDSVRLHFSVSDTGIGIPPERMEQIFAPFVQADGATNREYGGTGLGLAISRRLVGLMDGECGVASACGSQFWFNAVFGRVAGATGLSEALAGWPGRRFLVAGGSPAQQEYLADWLRSWQCRCDSAAGPEEVPARVGEAANAGDPYHAVLLDLPAADFGRWLCRWSEAAPELMSGAGRWIALLGAVDDIQIRRLQAVGIDACLSKPVTQFRLHDCLSLREPAVVAAAVEARRPYRILVVDDRAINRKLLLAVLDRLGYPADAVADGQACIGALRERRYDLVLMDCLMPAMDGYETTRRIRAEMASPRIPIIALTANAVSGDQDKCLAAGMDGYLAKPVDIEQLRLALLSHLETGSACQHGPSSAAGVG